MCRSLGCLCYGLLASQASHESVLQLGKCSITPVGEHDLMLLRLLPHELRWLPLHTADCTVRVESAS